MRASQPLDEPSRLKALRRYGILDTPPEPDYDGIARLIAQICQAPISVVNFIDENRQWFKAEVGLGVRETPLDISICAHAILQKNLFVVHDTLLDPRFCTNPLCISDPNLRFYAGALLETKDGYPLGTLCVLDYVPRELSDQQKDALMILARQVMNMLELRRSIQTLQASESLAHSIVESSPDWVSILDLEGRIQTINTQGIQQLEIGNADQWNGKTWLSFWSGNDANHADKALDTARSGDKGAFQGYAHTARGTPRYWDIAITPVLDSNKSPTQLVAVARDITKQREAEAKTRERVKGDSLRKLAGGVAHDFSNLLTIILGNASLLTEIGNSMSKPLAEEIVSASERAAEITRQMLAYSGKGRFFNQIFSLSRFVEEMEPVMQKAISFSQVKLVLDLDPTVPEIAGDTAQLPGMLMNVLTNAVEAMEQKEGTITIRTSTAEVDAAVLQQTLYADQAKPGAFVRLEIRDTGTGIAEQDLPRIFEPFVTSKFLGRGLGLAMVAGMMRGHKGALKVYSAPGYGSNFQFYFPVAHPERSILQHGSELPESWRSTGTILVLESEPVVQRLVKTTLESYGFQVLLVLDLQQALSTLSGGGRDFAMTVLNGFTPLESWESYQQVKEIRPNLPVILTNGYGADQVPKLFREQSAPPVLQTPYTMADLLHTVRNAL